MFSHVAVGTNDLEKAKRFYDDLMGTLGYGPGVADTSGPCQRYLYRSGTGLFIITTPRDGAPACRGNGVTVGFTAKSAAEVDSWHATGVANGGTSVEDPPGVRNTPGGGLYLAYLLDPDGNKLCALYRMPA